MKVAIAFSSDTCGVGEIDQPAAVQTRHEPDAEVRENRNRHVRTIIPVGNEDAYVMRGRFQLLEQRSQQPQFTAPFATPRPEGDHLNHRGRGGNQHDEPSQCSIVDRARAPAFDFSAADSAPDFRPYPAWSRSNRPVERTQGQLEKNG